MHLEGSILLSLFQIFSFTALLTAALQKCMFLQRIDKKDKYVSSPVRQKERAVWLLESVPKHTNSTKFSQRIKI